MCDLIVDNYTANSYFDLNQSAFVAHTTTRGTQDANPRLYIKWLRCLDSIIPSYL